MCTFKRRPYFADTAVSASVCAILLDTASMSDVEIVAYCFMPDHLHLLVEGKSAYADSRKWAGAFRRTSGFHFRRTHKGRLWQDGYYDRVHRAEDATLDVVSYIVLNPVRAGLCADASAYPFLGSSRYHFSQLLTATEWRPRSLG